MKRAASVEGWALGSPGTHCKRGIGKRESGSHTDAEWASATRGLQSHDGSEGSGAKGLSRDVVVLHGTVNVAPASVNVSE